MKHQILISSLAIFCACTSKPLPETSIKNSELRWYSEVRHKLEPLFKEKLKALSHELEAKYHHRIDNSDHPLKLYALVDSNGNVEDIKIIQYSDIEELDRSGVESFQELSPLPPPPETALKNGHVKIKWDFIVKD